VKTGPLHRQELYVIREGDPVGEMASDFCGDHLLTWALDPQCWSHFPISTRTVQALTKVEALSLAAEDLKSAASQFRRLHIKQLQHTFQVLFLILSLSLLKVNYNLFLCNVVRLYSVQWRTWGASFVQAAWRRHCRRKKPSTRRARTGKRDTAAAGSSSSLSLGAASRFASNVLRNVRHNLADPPPPRHTLASLPQKPMEPLLHRRSYKVFIFHEIPSSSMIKAQGSFRLFCSIRLCNQKDRGVTNSMKYSTSPHLIRRRASMVNFNGYLKFALESLHNLRLLKLECCFLFELSPDNSENSRHHYHGKNRS
ncbi:LOW QUALITY PROTEIN: hypothetical protein HID58_095825, partial [Brassica napus]